MTPDPRRSNALDVRFHGVRPRGRPADRRAGTRRNGAGSLEPATNGAERTRWKIRSNRTVDEAPHIRPPGKSVRYLMIMRAQRSRQVVRMNSAYGTSTVRSPGASGWGQIFSTSASGIVVAVTAIVPAVISATSDGSSAR